MEKLFRGLLPLFAILVLALGLRCYGLHWGLPNANHVDTYHPDELTVVSTSVLALDSLNGKMLPHFYNYGSLQLYLVNFACTLSYLCGGVDLTPAGRVATNRANWDELYLIARSLSVVMGVGTVWVTAAIGTRLWNRRVGLLAASMLAVAPIHVLQSHWATVDVPATFWGALSILAAVWSVQDKVPWKGAILSGLFAGLASATKYNMPIFILPLVAASVCAAWKGSAFFAGSGSRGETWRGKGMAVAAAGIGILMCVVGFLCGCPGFLAEHALFVKDFNIEALHVSKQPGDTFSQTGNGLVYEWTHTLVAGLGPLLLLLAVLGIMVAIWRKDRPFIIIAAAALPYSVLIGLAAVRYARYSMPLMPLLCLFAAFAVISLYDGWAVLARPDDEVSSNVSRWRPVISIGTLLAIGLTFGYTLWLIVPLSVPDPRDRAVQWLNTHTALSSTTAFPTMPWFQTAPVCPYFPSQRGVWQEYPALALQSTRSVLYSGDWSLADLAQSPGSVVVSEYDTMDALRVKNPSAIAYMSALNNGYKIGFEAGGYGAVPGLFMQHLPHDMIYANPEIQVYVPR
jgi:hypothetical protein